MNVHSDLSIVMSVIILDSTLCNLYSALWTESVAMFEVTFAEKL